MRLRTQVLLILLLPLLGLIGLSSSLVVEKRHRLADMTAFEDLAIFATEVSDLVHDLQKERGVKQHMGDDTHVMLVDVSSSIMAKGRHWGGDKAQ